MKALAAIYNLACITIGLKLIAAINIKSLNFQKDRKDELWIHTTKLDNIDFR